MTTHSSHKVVVITGASAGVGRALALRFGRAGWRIGLIARDEQALAQVKSEVERLGGKALVAAADVADADAVFAAADTISQTFGTIDVWINDAMVTVFSPVWKMTPKEYRRVTEVTYLGFVHGTMAALRHMRPRNRGKIIQIGSALAYRGIPLQSAYCGAKHAIRGFTDSVRTELIHEESNIEIMIAELPAVNTPQFDWARTHMAHEPRPVGPVVQPETVANIVFKAARQPHREIWIGLSTLKVILGNMALPSFLDRYLAHAAFRQQATRRPVAVDRSDNLMFPLRGLHRTEGSFGGEASRQTTVASGPIARAFPVLVGAALALAVGVMAGSAISRSHDS